MLVLVFLFSVVSAQQLYVNNASGSNCSDSFARAQNSSSQPWCTIEAANQKHLGGDTINIMPGVYRDSIWPKAGTASQFTVFQGVGPREQVIVLGSEQITGWTQPDSINHPNIWKSTVPQIEPSPAAPYQKRQEATTDGVVVIDSTDCFQNRTNWLKRASLVVCNAEYNAKTNNYHLDPLTAITGPGQMFFKPDTDEVYVWAYNNQNPNNTLIECSVRPFSYLAGEYYPTNYLPSYFSLPQRYAYFAYKNLTVMQSLNMGVWMDGRIHDVNITNNVFAYNGGPNNAIGCSGTGGNTAVIIHEKYDFYGAPADDPKCGPGYPLPGQNCYRPGMNVIGNLIHDNIGSGEDPYQGIQFYHSGYQIISDNEVYNQKIGVYLKGGNRDITIRNNNLHNLTENGIMLQWQMHSIFVEDNIIWNGPTMFSEISTDDYVAAGDTIKGNIQVRQNVFNNLNGSGLSQKSEYGAIDDSITFKNNIIYNPGQYGFFLGKYGSNPISMDSEHNLFYKASRAITFYKDGPCPGPYPGQCDLQDWRNATGNDIYSIETNPLFVNPSSGDFTLQSTSPAINAGEFISGYHCSLADDAGGSSLTGCRHWRGSAPDLGAIEFGGTPAPCTTGQTRSCSTTESCPGIQTCTAGSWGSCVDIPDDGCPVIPCTNGDTQPCTTTENCPGTQTCVSGSWAACTDNPSDGCPTPSPGSITATHLVPSSDSSFPQGQAFTYQTKVSCSGGYCGNITATLDPLLSLNKPATASSTETSSFGPEKAVDGSTAYGSRWASNYNSTAWWQVDLQNTYNITSIDLVWDASYALEYKVQVSEDGSNWIQAFHETASNGGTDSITLSNNARYIKIECLQKGRPGSNYSIQEVSVFGDDSTAKGVIPKNAGTPFYTTNNNPQTCTNLADGSSCTNTWSVIPTGGIGEEYSFFVKYQPENASIPSKNTTIKMITISEGTGCQENWTCTEWSACIGGNQTRTCTDNNDCGTENNKPPESESCTECDFTDFRPCTTTESCDGTQYCNQNGTWDPVCFDTFPDDNCPILACADSELITELCECGGENYSTGYCCQNTHQTTPCISDCVEGPITEACYCGTEEYDSGYCCGVGGMNPPTHQTYSCDATCSPGTTQACNTSDDCAGIQTCNASGFWSSCVDTPDDDCPACVPDWGCGSWSACINGSQTRTCVDDNDCGSNTGKPSENQACGVCDFTDVRDCTTDEGCTGSQVCDVTGNWDSICYDNNPEDNCPACVEEWSCGSWNSCTNGNQTRNCTDLSECGTTEFKPSISQSCGTCSSGVTQACTTSQGCAGIQTCVNESWGSCADITGDGCPTTTNLKELILTVEPQPLKDLQDFTVTVKTKAGASLNNVKINYALKNYYTNTEGKAKLKTQKEYITLTASKTGYRNKIIELNITTPYCGNTKCEQPEENQTTCPQDCTPAIKELQITTSVSNNEVTVKITNLQEQPLENAEVMYGNETKNTGIEGTVIFTELSGTQTITAKKTGYQTKSIIYASVKCITGETRACTTSDSCSGTQTCTNGNWNSCIDNPTDQCPTQTNQTITPILAAILIIGIIIFVITKVNVK